MIFVWQLDICKLALYLMALAMYYQFILGLTWYCGSGFFLRAYLLETHIEKVLTF